MQQLRAWQQEPELPSTVDVGDVGPPENPHGPRRVTGQGADLGFRDLGLKPAGKGRARPQTAQSLHAAKEKTGVPEMQIASRMPTGARSDKNINSTCFFHAPPAQRPRPESDLLDPVTQCIPAARSENGQATRATSLVRSGNVSCEDAQAVRAAVSELGVVRLLLGGALFRAKHCTALLPRDCAAVRP